MKRILLLLALASCGLEDFSFGGAKDPCEVRWTMSFHGLDELDRVRPRVSEVQDIPDGIVWTASYGLSGEVARIRFRITGARLDVLESNVGEMSDVEASHCIYDEWESELREEPLARHSCSVVFRDDGPPVPGGPIVFLQAEADYPYLVLEEIDHCSGA